MKQILYRLLAILLALVCLMPAVTNANAAESPSQVVIMKNTPEDAAVFHVTENGLKELTKSQVAWETCHVLHRGDIGGSGDIKLVVSRNGSAYEQAVGKQYLYGYNSVITWDIAAQTITGGKLLTRSILLVSMRVLFTLSC